MIPYAVGGSTAIWGNRNILPQLVLEYTGNLGPSPVGLLRRKPGDVDRGTETGRRARGGMDG